MTLNIGSSLTGGFRRVANRNGLLLLVAYLFLGLVWQVAFYSAVMAWLQQSDVSTSDVALPSFEAPSSILAGVAALSLLLLLYLTVVAIRTFVGGHSRSIPSEYYTRNIVYVLINAIVGNIVYGLLVAFGSILFLIPGIIAYVAFPFAIFYISSEDKNFVAALRDSWSLTRGHWLRLFLLFLIVFIGNGIIAGIGSVITMVAVTAVSSQIMGTLVSGLFYLPFSLLTLGILAEAFIRLRDSQGAEDEAFANI
ncbi:hypothetical protein [Natrinema marinum]|uniref:hypothetical protein n=1 Tax=Natrinema marinum TaxID=2961598 RepID=UPI0020C8B948|nr:hypothetical protein [Natrinema marinum]